MAVALVGLVSFQMYWINLAVEVKNERFTQSVHEALEAVSKGLEKQEILYLASQRIRQAERQKAEQQLAREEDLRKRREAKKTQLAKSANKSTSYYAHRQVYSKNKTIKGSKSEKWGSLGRTVSPTEWINIMDAETMTFFQPSLSQESSGWELNSLLEQNWPRVEVLSAFPFEPLPSEMPYPYHPDQVSGFRPKKPDEFLKKGKKNKLVTKNKNRALVNPLGKLNYLSFNQSDSLTWTMKSGGVTFSYQTLPGMMHGQLKDALFKELPADSLFRDASNGFYFSDMSLNGMPRIVIRHSIPQPRHLEKEEDAFINQFYANLDTVESIKTSFKENFDKVEKKSEMMQDVFKELVTVERTIRERVNPKVLDSLLRKEIRDRGIDIPFVYGVHERQNKNVLFASTGSHVPNDLLTSGYHVNLFPNDVFCADNYLMVSFPGQKKYIFQKLSFVFLSSAILIIVIVSCFYVAISTILKQKKLSEVKNDFINNMTHEFKTPIATISLACEVLQEGAVNSDPAKLNRYLHVIQDENKRLGSQVEKVLQTALLDKGNLKLKISRVDVHEVIDIALQNIGVQIEQRHGSIQLDLKANQPVVEADEVHLTNIVHNLLDNANKYSPDEPQIKIETRSEQDGVYLTVFDKGIGMTKETVQRIFERFYRVPTGNVHNVKGFGLGLSYVKTILQLHHGNIRVESQPNKGSSFEVFLPYAQG